MADFVAVLKKTIEGLTDKSPEMREKVYRKARDTVAAKLAAIDPPPSRIVVDRQTRALEDAIKAVEASFLEKPAADDFESVLAGMEASRPAAPVVREAQPAPPPPAAAFSPPPRAPADEVAAEAEPVAAAVPLEQDDELVPVAVQQPEPKLALPLAGDATVARTKRRVPMGLIAALVALVVVVAAGYGLWLNRDDLGSLFGSGGGTVAEGEQTKPAEAPAQQAAPAASEPETPAGGQMASTETEQPRAAGGDTQPAAAETPKYTQRLMSDGKEVDEGPADGGQSVGEGTSMASATQLADNSATGQTAPGAAAPQPAETQQTRPADQALPVGQRAIFYEERTSLAEGTADTGSAVWTLVNESPGNDLPPEPAIRAEVNIPSKNVQLKMTIRRNADTTLPASHIIEMIFLGNFEGGGIESVLRVALKGSEAAPGNPLIGIPARITDGYFLIALSSSEAERNTNLELLLRQSWLDIPIVYKSGRRALVTVEKGVPVEKVFQEVIQDW